MGEQRERQRIKSRVDEFPDEIRAQMDGMLADVNYTYQEIADTLTEQGYEISRSAVGRYAMRHNSAARRLKEAREQTTALLQQIRENQDVESTELASAILIDGLTRRIATAEEDFDALPLDDLQGAVAEGTSGRHRVGRAECEGADAPDGAGRPGPAGAAAATGERGSRGGGGTG